MEYFLRFFGLLFVLWSGACHRHGQVAPAMVKTESQAEHLAQILSHTEPDTLPAKNITAAQKHLEQGLQAFDHGAYTACETELNQALELNPFVAEAYFVLGKVYMLYGVARDDTKTLLRAQSMLRMALRINSRLAQATELLKLLEATLETRS